LPPAISPEIRGLCYALRLRISAGNSRSLTIDREERVLDTVNAMTKRANGKIAIGLKNSFAKT